MGTPAGVLGVVNTNSFPTDPSLPVPVPGGKRTIDERSNCKSCLELGQFQVARRASERPVPNPSLLPAHLPEDRGLTSLPPFPDTLPFFRRPDVPERETVGQIVHELQRRRAYMGNPRSRDVTASRGRRGANSPCRASTNHVNADHGQSFFPLLEKLLRSE